MNLSDARKQFSRVGLAAFAATAVTYGVQWLLMPLVTAVWPAFTDHPWYIWLAGSLPLYLFGFPCAALILRGTPKKVTPVRDFTPRQFAGTFAAGYALLFAGNTLGNLLMMAVQALSGRESGNVVVEALENTDLTGILLFAVILAPVAEEWLFRGLIYDRLAVFGPGWATAISALLFGLFHGNFYQLFYAVGVGLVLGWLKARTGRLHWGIWLHMIINFMGSVIPLALQDVLADPDATAELTALTPELLLAAVYSLLMVWLTAAGVLVLVRHRKAALRELAVDPGPGIWQQAVRAPGMWLALGFSLVIFLLNILV